MQYIKAYSPPAPVKPCFFEGGAVPTLLYDRLGSFFVSASRDSVAKSQNRKKIFNAESCPQSGSTIPLTKCPLDKAANAQVTKQESLQWPLLLSLEATSQDI